MKLVKLHRKYLFSKINIIIIFILAIIAFIFAISTIKVFDSEVSRWMNRVLISENYEQSYLMFVKIIIIIFSSYLFGMAFSRQGDSYAAIINPLINKGKYFITKVISLIMMYTMVWLILLFNYLLINILFNKWYYYEINTFKNFLDIYLLGIVYGYFSIIMIRLINSSYIIIVVFGLYLISELLLEYDNNFIVTKILNMFFPSTYMVEDGYTLMYGRWHLIIISFLYTLIGYVCYLRKE